VCEVAIDYRAARRSCCASRQHNMLRWLGELEKKCGTVTGRALRLTRATRHLATMQQPSQRRMARARRPPGSMHTIRSTVHERQQGRLIPSFGLVTVGRLRHPRIVAPRLTTTSFNLLPNMPSSPKLFPSRALDMVPTSPDTDYSSAQRSGECGCLLGRACAPGAHPR
jgi:hypothetical protein